MSTPIHQGLPFTAADARGFGWNRRLLDEAVAAHRVRRVVRGVYVDQSVTDSRDQRLASIRRIAPAHAVACNETAAWIWGVDTFKPSQRYLLQPSFVVPHGESRMRRTTVQCRQAKIASADIAEIDGVLLTTPLRTTTDLLRTLYRPHALAAADGMAGVGLVDVDQVSHTTYTLKGFPGILQARELALLIDPLAASPGESWQRLRLVDAGMPTPVSQFEVVDAFGRSRFLDLAYPEVRVGVEFDGREYHTDPEHRRHDEARRAYLCTVLGWRIVVAGHSDIFGADTAFERSVGELLGIAPKLPRTWGDGRAHRVAQ